MLRLLCLRGPDAQAKRLREDGIEVVNNRVDLEKYGW
jgi:hypothetical protein